MITADYILPIKGGRGNVSSESAEKCSISATIKKALLKCLKPFEEKPCRPKTAGQITPMYFLKLFIHKLDASLQIVLYMAKITLTMKKTTTTVK